MARTNTTTGGGGGGGPVTGLTGTANQYVYIDNIGNGTGDKPFKLQGYTVATLPTGAVGYTAYVTDALTPTFGAVVIGGGAVKIPVFFDGTDWIVG